MRRKSRIFSYMTYDAILGSPFISSKSISRVTDVWHGNEGRAVTTMDGHAAAANTAIL